AAGRRAPDALVLAASAAAPALASPPVPSPDRRSVPRDPSSHLRGSSVADRAFQGRTRGWRGARLPFTARDAGVAKSSGLRRAEKRSESRDRTRDRMLP